MENLSSIVGQLKKERDRVQQQLSGLNAALAAFAGVYSNRGGKSAPAQKRKRRPMSAKGRAAIRRAQKARWAKVRAAKKSIAFVEDGRTPVLHAAPARLARCAA